MSSFELVLNESSSETNSEWVTLPFVLLSGSPPGESKFSMISPLFNIPSAEGLIDVYSSSMCPVKDARNF